MPLYEFTCPNEECKAKFTELVSMGTQSIPCPSCGPDGGIAHKSAGSYLFAAHGLENGHIAVGRKLTGKGQRFEQKAGKNGVDIIEAG